jgi:hypothetical protein
LRTLARLGEEQPRDQQQGQRERKPHEKYLQLVFAHSAVIACLPCSFNPLFRRVVSIACLSHL